MIKLKQAAQAGTVESSDILISLMPADSGSGIQIELVSPTIKQYGTQIKAAIRQVLISHGVEDAKVYANDKGALEYTIMARTLTALERGLGGKQSCNNR